MLIKYILPILAAAGFLFGGFLPWSVLVFRAARQDHGTGDRWGIVDAVDRQREYVAHRHSDRVRCRDPNIDGSGIGLCRRATEGAGHPIEAQPGWQS